MKRTPLKRTGIKSKSKKAKPVPKDIYQDVLARDMGCRGAGLVRIPCQGRIDPHHMKRRSQGGQDTLENLISLCRAHHDWVHQNVNESVELGLLKRAWDE